MDEAYKGVKNGEEMAFDAMVYPSYFQ